MTVPGAGFLATSADGVGVLVHLSAGPDQHARVPVVVEIKSKTTDSTEAKGRLLASTYGRVVTVDFGTDAFRALVEDSSHRCQVLHHTMVYNVHRAMYVTASMTEILQVVVVHFSQPALACYGHLLTTVASNTLSWVYGDQPMPELPPDLGHAVDKDTILTTLELWRALDREAARGVLPPATHILPRAASVWNSLKGGVDVYSRIHKNVKIDFSSLPPRTYMFLRQIFSLLQNAHIVTRLIALHSKMPQLQTLQQFNNAKKKECSFRVSLGRLQEVYVPPARAFILESGRTKIGEERAHIEGIKKKISSH